MGEDAGSSDQTDGRLIEVAKIRGDLTGAVAVTVAV